MTDSNLPVELRESGGIRIYYILPVQDSAVGVFEHVATWPDLAAAHAHISDLEAADARRAELAADATAAITSWNAAADGPSGDDEHEAARDVADVLEALLTALQESSLV